MLHDMEQSLNKTAQSLEKKKISQFDNFKIKTEFI